MLRSMTGFGQAERTFAGYSVQLEVRSVNHRYCEITIRQPREWNRYEDMLKKAVLQYIKRGRIEIHITAERLLATQKQVDIDWSLLQAYYDASEQIRTRFQLVETLALKDLLFAPEAVQFRDMAETSFDEIEQPLLQCLQKAMTQFMQMREAEGSHLYVVLAEHLQQLEAYRKDIFAISPSVVAEYKQKLELRLQDLLSQDQALDETRLAMEAAIFADKCDLQEELARLHSHLQQFQQLMDDDEPSGRRMDFLLQEMNREVNTMGSKANHVYVTNHVVAMKAELEKLREQVQNIE